MSLCDNADFLTLEARFAVEGRRAARQLRLEVFQIQRRYRHVLAHKVAARIVTLENYLVEWRTFQDERNVRVVARYFRKYPLEQIRKAA